jgi:hypothetical protein
MGLWYTPPVRHKQSADPAIKREKLVIEKIGLAGLLFLWMNALSVSFVVPLVCGLALFHSLWIGILAGTLVSAAVGARAVYRIRWSIRQWQVRHRRLAREELSSRNANPDGGGTA